MKGLEEKGRPVTAQNISSGSSHRSEISEKYLLPLPK
jgi:hypothetical protein